MSAHVFPQMESQRWFEAWVEARTNSARHAQSPQTGSDAAQPRDADRNQMESKKAEDWTANCLFDWYNQ